MKKSIFGVFAGILLGILLMVVIVAVLNMKPDNEAVLAQSKDSVVSETMSEEESEPWSEDSELTEMQVAELEEEIETSETEESESEEGESEVSETEERESEEETESEEKKQEKPQSVTTTKKEPVKYPYYIRVNRLANCVTVYTKDDEGKYTVPVKAMVCSVGLTGDTPLGVNAISARYKWRPLFGGTYGQYSVRFNGHILFHSVPYTKASKDALKEGQYNMLGQPASQGCVRLSTADAKWIYDNCVNGTKVEVYESTDPGPLGKPSSYKISDNSPYRGWDPTDPDSANPWKHGSVAITGVKDIMVNQGESADLMVGVGATDVDGLPLNVTVSGKVDWNTAGKYTVTYKATGVLGMTATSVATVTVNEVKKPEPPVEPEVPVEPEKPAEPQPPVEPEVPVEPEKPAEPQVPVEPEVPAEPEKPEEPKPPVESETPEESELPEETESSEVLETTEAVESS